MQSSDSLEAEAAAPADLAGLVSAHGARLELHGVDAARLADRALNDALRSSNAYLSPHEREDARAFLLSELWRASLTFDPSYGSTFSTIGYRTARRRFVDWQRQRLGRTRWQHAARVHERERPEVVSLDAPGGGDRLDAALAGGSGDGAADRLAARDGLLGLGSGSEDRDHELLRRAARRLARR